MPAQNNLLERRYGKVRLAHTAWPHHQQSLLYSLVAGRGHIFVGESLDDELRLRKAAVPGFELLARNVFELVVRFEIFEIAVAVALRNARPRKRPLRAISCRAIARDGPDHPWLACGGPGLCCFRRCQGLRSARRSLNNPPSAACA